MEVSLLRKILRANFTCLRAVPCLECRSREGQASQVRQPASIIRGDRGGTAGRL
jgi:hypothetical protein